MEMAMETRDMTYVLAVDEHRGIGRAAEALGLTQPALSKAIQRVENALGVPLFDRGPTGMSATLAGQAFIRRATRIRLEYEDALKEVQGIRSGEHGLLRIGSSPSVPPDLIVTAGRRLLRERPVARLRLSRRFAGDLIEMVAAGQLDLAVVPLPESDLSTFQVRKLFDDRLRIVADESHPLRRRRRLPLRALSDQQWLLPGGQFAIRQQIELAFRAQGLAPPLPRVEVDFGGVLTFDLIRGFGMITVVGAETGGPMGGFAPLDVDPAQLDLRREVGVVMRAGAYVSPLAERMIALLEAARP
jgi:DNA-binding transcriptional LysR family regulator